MRLHEQRRHVFAPEGAASRFNIHDGTTSLTPVSLTLHPLFVSDASDRAATYKEVQRLCTVLGITAPPLPPLPPAADPPSAIVGVIDPSAPAPPGANPEAEKEFEV